MKVSGTSAALEACNVMNAIQEAVAPVGQSCVYYRADGLG
jgi:hypothetical protein